MRADDDGLQKLFELAGHDLPALLQLMDAFASKKPRAELERLAKRLRRSR